MEGNLSDLIGQSGRWAPSPCFPKTAWTKILHAQQASPGSRANELDLLITRYWKPVYCFIRRSRRSHDDAMDFTQDFFTKFIEKDIIKYADKERGKFRTFLLASVKRFLIQKHRESQRRPKHRPLMTLHGEDEVRAYEPSEERTPEDEFDRNWAVHLLHDCIETLRRACENRGRAEQYQVFRMKFFYDGPKAPKGREIAEKLGLKETDVDNAFRLAKQRFEKILRDELLDVCADAADFKEEVANLLALIAPVR